MRCSQVDCCLTEQLRGQSLLCFDLLKVGTPESNPWNSSICSSSLSWWAPASSAPSQPWQMQRSRPVLQVVSKRPGGRGESPAAPPSLILLTAVWCCWSRWWEPHVVFVVPSFLKHQGLIVGAATSQILDIMRPITWGSKNSTLRKKGANKRQLRVRFIMRLWGLFEWISSSWGLRCEQASLISHVVWLVISGCPSFPQFALWNVFALLWFHDSLRPARLRSHSEDRGYSSSPITAKPPNKSRSSR